jgi:hypothetical protein
MLLRLAVAALMSSMLAPPSLSEELSGTATNRALGCAILRLARKGVRFIARANPFICGLSGMLETGGEACCVPDSSTATKEVWDDEME